MGKDYKHQITTVFIFRTGMVAVCDQHGQQMPVFQNPDGNAMERIKNRVKRQSNKVVEWVYQ